MGTEYSLNVPNERDQYRVRGETHDLLPPALFPSASDVSNALGKSPSTPLVPTHGSALSQVDGNVSGERGIVTEDWFDALQCSVDGECKCASILRSGLQNSRNLLSWGTFIRPKDSCWPEVALARARSVPEFIRPMCSCWGTFIRPKDSCWPEVALARARSVPEFIRPMGSCWPEVEVARSGQKAAYRAYFVFQLQAVVIFTQYRAFFRVSLISLCLKIFRGVARSKLILGGCNSWRT